MTTFTWSVNCRLLRSNVQLVPSLGAGALHAAGLAARVAGAPPRPCASPPFQVAPGLAGEDHRAVAAGVAVRRHLQRQLGVRLALDQRGGDRGQRHRAVGPALHEQLAPRTRSAARAAAAAGSSGPATTIRCRRSRPPGPPGPGRARATSPASARRRRASRIRRRRIMTPSRRRAAWSAGDGVRAPLPWPFPEPFACRPVRPSALGRGDLLGRCSARLPRRAAFFGGGFRRAASSASGVASPAGRSG